MSWTEIKGLREQRAKLIADAGEIVKAAHADNKRSLTNEENSKWENLHAESEKLAQRIEQLERQERAQKSVEELIGRDASAPATTDKEMATRAFAKRMRGDRLNADETRALDSAGSGFVPDTFIDTFVRISQFDGGVIEAGAHVVETPDGRHLPVARLDDTANTGELIGENTQVGGLDGSADPTDDSVNLDAFIFTSKAIKLPLTMVRDASVDLVGVVAELGATRIANRYNYYATLGSGSGQPQGCVTGASLGKATATTTTVTYNEIVELIGSLNEIHIRGAVLMGNAATRTALRKLVDGNGNPLWNQGNVAAGFPETLGGLKYILNPHMASVGTAGNKFLLCANFTNGYWARRVRQVEVLELPNYREYLQAAWVSYQSLGGVVVNSNAIKYMQHPSS